MNRFAISQEVEKKKAALAKTLIAAFDVLLLDEPTNHLDNEMLNWLEEYLNKYRGVIVMVTHDRYFLDRVTNKILEIDHGQLYGYDANYSKFLEMKAQREEMEAASERKKECPAYGAGVGEAGMPCEKHKTKSQAGEAGRAEKRRCRII